MKFPKILYCGDSAVGGAANYMLGVLSHIPADVTHVPPDKKLTTQTLQKQFDAILLSDYPRHQVSKAIEKKILHQVDEGAGLMMVGGWASFSGPFGGWHGSEIEKKLPVKCLVRDDRLNFPGGAHLSLGDSESFLSGVTFKNSPAICGMNEVRMKNSGKAIVSARKIVTVGSNLTLDPIEHPLLVVNKDKNTRIAAYTSDFAPHWCGGLVDWGARHIKLAVARGMHVEVGNTYIKFITNLILWLSRRK